MEKTKTNFLQRNIELDWFVTKTNFYSLVRLKTLQSQHLGLRKLVVVLHTFLLLYDRILMKVNFFLD
jgi:hypothetical protein